MGNLHKYPLFLSSTPIPPLTTSFCPPQMKFDLYFLQNILDLALRKSTIGEEIWIILCPFSSGVVF